MPHMDFERYRLLLVGKEIELLIMNKYGTDRQIGICKEDYLYFAT